MAHFVTFAAFTALIFGLILFQIRRFVPVRVPTLFLTVGTSFLLTILFPYFDARLPWGRAVMIHSMLVIACAFAIYFFDRSSLCDEQSNLTPSMPGAELNLTPVGDGGWEQMPPGKEHITASEPERQQEELTGASPETAIIEEREGKASSTEQQIISGTAGSVVAGITEEFLPQRDEEDEYAATETDMEEQISPQPPAGVDSFPEPETTAERSAPGTEPEEFSEPLKEQPENHDETLVAATVESPAEDDAEGAPADGRDPVYTYISRGFNLRQAGKLIEAVDCFTKAGHLTANVKLNCMLATEISAVYSEMGQQWQAAEILKVTLEIMGPRLDLHSRWALEANLKSLLNNH